MLSINRVLPTNAATNAPFDLFATRCYRSPLLAVAQKVPDFARQNRQSHPFNSAEQERGECIWGWEMGSKIPQHSRMNYA